MTRPSRRTVMYALVAAQLVVLGVMIAPHELNMALDRGPTVDVEIVHARAAKDPFRGASVTGRSALDLDGSTAVLPAGLHAGDHVVVAFGVQPGRRPRIVAVERGRKTPPFTATTFTIPGRVVRDGEHSLVGRRDGRVIALVGKPAVAIELDLPEKIAIDDGALARLAGPSIVRANLHAGWLGHRYFTDVRLTGRAWSPDVRFAYDEARERLVVFAPRETMLLRGGALTTDAPLRSDLFVFDSSGKELVAAEVQGRLLDGAVDANGQVLALVSSERWGSSNVSLVRLGDDGQSLQRGPSLALDRVLGFDAAAGAFWVVAAPTSTRPPHFIQRVGVAGFREPRLGPFDSVPRAVVSVGDDVWVLEADRHRITRLDAASGRVVREYRDLNAPFEMAVDGKTVYVVEANRTQLTALADDGRILWRVPRFQGLTWVVPDPVTGGGWVGASTFEGASAAVLRFERDGTIARVPASARPLSRSDWRRRVGADVVRSSRDGRLFFLEDEAIAILGADGATVTRVVGFRFSTDQRLRS